jgi:hypothetical protein
MHPFSPLHHIDATKLLLEAFGDAELHQQHRRHQFRLPNSWEWRKGDRGWSMGEGGAEREGEMVAKMRKYFISLSSFIHAPLVRSAWMGKLLSKLRLWYFT